MRRISWEASQSKAGYEEIKRTPAGKTNSNKGGKENQHVILRQS